MKLTAVILSAALLSSGCAVYMASEGKPDPNLGLVQVGATRAQVELQLGRPKHSATVADGSRTDTYEFKTGDDKSPGRAIGHAVMDILTFLIWEPIGTLIEFNQGEKQTLTVTYGSDGRVQAIGQ